MATDGDPDADLLSEQIRYYEVAARIEVRTEPLMMKGAGRRPAPSCCVG